jgi:hypothetical protein
MHEKDIDFQLVPPGVDCCKAAEGAIRAFKDHLIAGLCSVDEDFPLCLWDRLLPQALLALNLMHGSQINLKELSAWAQMNGTFAFNRTPLVPPGVRAIACKKPDKHSSWSPHGLNGWCAGPALDSHRCHATWTWDTRSIRICDALSWFPTKASMPIASSDDLILAGIKDILKALCNPTRGSPLDPLTDNHVTAMQVLSDLITGLIPIPVESTLTPKPSPAPPLGVAIPTQTPSPLRVDPVVAPPVPTLTHSKAFSKKKVKKKVKKKHKKKSVARRGKKSCFWGQEKR